MSITSMGMVWAAALFAAAPSGDGSRLEEYGGQYRCNDETVKAQVVRALGPDGAPYQASAIQAAPGKLVYDAKPAPLTVGKATSIVSQPGASGSPSQMKLSRAAAGAAVDVLMCRYRRSSSKAWTSIGTADLVVDGQLAKRMPADVAKLGRGFALHEDAHESEDSVLVLVAAGVGGKLANFEVTAAAQGLQRKRKGKDRVPSGKSDVGKQVLAEAAKPEWKTYAYNQVVVFPEAAEIWDYENKKFDCSYFVWLVYNRVGIEYDFTGTLGLSQLGGGQFEEVSKPRPGDLVVWRFDDNTGHVGIVLDDESFYDNSSKASVGVSKFAWDAYKKPHQFLRRKGT